MIQSVLDTFKTEGSDDQFYQKKKKKRKGTIYMSKWVMVKGPPLKNTKNG